MTVNELYRSLLSDLEQLYERSEAANISYMIFEHITGISRQGIIKDPGTIVDKKTEDLFVDCVKQLKMHKPVQYVIGEAWFYKMKLKVSPAVLIPRPETEELVELVTGYLHGKRGLSVLDIGTGSGCIAIAIKKNRPETNVTAIDISSDALTIAKENSIEQQTDINFIQTDFLNENIWNTLPSFDVIISNPPYIPANEQQVLDKNVVEFEPHLALFVEDNRPLLFYEKIAAFGKTHLNESGKIFLETHEQLAEETAALFNTEIYTAEIKKDLFEKQRMVIVSRRFR